MGLLSSIGKGIAKSLDVLTVSLAHPIATATAVVSKKSTVQDVVTSHFAQPLKEQVKDIVLGTAGIAATVVAGAAVGTAAKAGTLAPAAAKLIPSTTKGKVIAAVAAPAVIGAVVNQPVKSLTTVAKAPSELAQFGGDIANFAATPSVESGKQLVTQSPLLASAAGLLIAGGAVSKLAPAIATARQTEAIQEQTQAILDQKEITVVDKSAEFKAMPSNQIAPTSEVAPQVQSVSKGATTPKKRKKTVSKPVIASMRQNVNVIVSNRQTNKYKKEMVLV